MNRIRNPTFKSVMKRYVEHDSSIGSRSVLVQFSFVLRSILVNPSFILRSSSVRASFGLRSGSVRAPFGNRRTIEDVSEVYRRQNGGQTEMHRMNKGMPTVWQPVQNFIFKLLKSFYYGKTYWNYFQTQWFCR